MPARVRDPKPEVYIPADGAAPRFEVVPLDSLHQDPANPRQRTDRSRKVTRASIARFHPARSIVIDGKGVVRAGNGTVEAAEAEGISEVLIVDPRPGQLVAVRRADWSDTEATAYSVADNRSSELSAWTDDLGATLEALQGEDFNLDDLGFNGEEMAALLGQDDDPDPDGSGEDRGAQVDRAAELQEKWQTASGQLWVIPSKTVSGKGHRLFCGDSTKAEDVARLMDGEKAQGVFTSPPYAEQRKDQYGGTPADRYVEWWDAVQANVRSHLRDDGSFFVNIKAHCEDGERSLYVMDLVLAMKRRWLWRYVDEFAWLRKGIPGGWDKRFKNAWEPVYQFALNVDFKIRIDNVLIPSAVAMGTHSPSKAEWKRHGESAFESFDDDALEARPSNVLDIKDTEPGVLHSAPFPVRLPTWFFSAFSDPGDIWFEPFCGSGTTIVAAEQTGRLCCGNELAPKYCAVTLERLADMGLEPHLA